MKHVQAHSKAPEKDLRKEARACRGTKKKMVTKSAWWLIIRDEEKLYLPMNSLSPVAMNSKGLKSSPRRFKVPHTTPGAPGRCVTCASPAAAAFAVPRAIAAAHMSTPFGVPLTLGSTEGVPLTLGSTDRLRDIAIRHFDLALDMVVLCAFTCPLGAEDDASPTHDVHDIQHLLIGSSNKKSIGIYIL